MARSAFPAAAFAAAPVAAPAPPAVAFAAAPAAAVVVKANKAHQAACVPLPAGVTQYGKDGYRLPNGFIVFGHGVCIVTNEEDYTKVAAFRGTKRAAEDGEDAETPADKEEAKQRRKAARLVRHLPLVQDYLEEADKSKLQRLAERLASSAAPRGPATGPIKPAPSGSDAEPEYSSEEAEVAAQEAEEARLADQVGDVMERRLERAQTGYWNELLGEAPAESESDAEVQEAVREASAAATQKEVMKAVFGEEEGSGSEEEGSGSEEEGSQEE